MNLNLLVDLASGNWMGVLWCSLVGLGLGAILGIALWLCGHFLEKKEDERVSEVAKMLPGYNCGSCGYPGCHEMAEAIVRGEVKKLSTCRPGRKEKNFDPIVAYLSEHKDAEGKPETPEI